MKQFTTIKALAADFKRTAMISAPRCAAGNIEYKAKLVNATLTIRCYPSQPDVIARARKLESAYTIALGGTDSYKASMKAIAIREKLATPKTANKRAAFSWSIVKDMLISRHQPEDQRIENALNYLRTYNRVPTFGISTRIAPDILLVDVMPVPNYEGLVTAKILVDGGFNLFAIHHVASGKTTASITQHATRAGSIKLLEEMDQDRLERVLKAQVGNTFQNDARAKAGF
tara:strand:+ start:21490 stop:22179 length:690 start_codon:yes stop_codon:yes gene_type:complete